MPLAFRTQGLQQHTGSMRQACVSMGVGSLAPLTVGLLQAAKKSSKEQAGHTERAGTVTIVRQVLAEQGFLGFFAGMRAKIVQSVLAAALMFMLKERLHAAMMRALTSRKG
jgi:hypothetical protein